VVVVHEGHIAGWAHVCLVDGLELARFAEIRALVVDPEKRRLGAGRALVAEAIRWAKERKVQKLRVRSNVLREEAHRFYPALGFALTKTQACYDLALPAD
jgi:GNAT superfamily N-acetyltransferase